MSSNPRLLNRTPTQLLRSRPRPRLHLVPTRSSSKQRASHSQVTLSVVQLASIRAGHGRAPASAPQAAAIQLTCRPASTEACTSCACCTSLYPVTARIPLHSPARTVHAARCAWDTVSTASAPHKLLVWDRQGATHRRGDQGPGSCDLSGAKAGSGLENGIRRGDLARGRR